jgi:CubicO group peptidase (beta-lactamase class C family)
MNNYSQSRFAPSGLRAIALACFLLPIAAMAAPNGEKIEALLAPEKVSFYNIHSVLVLHKGTLIAENYYRGTDKSMADWFTKERQFTANDLHDMRSISKTVVGLAVGMAIDEGKIPSVAMPLVQRPEIQLGHVLSMTSGLSWNERVDAYGTLANDETQLFFRFRRTNYILGKERQHPPGTVYNYSGGATHVLADIVSTQTGESFTDYIAKKLFAPLGITHYEWRNDFLFRPISFAGLRLTPKDLLKIGQLMLNQGVWDGRQLVSKQWIEDSFTPKVKVNATLNYGYHWWLGKVKVNRVDHAYAAAVGNGGQRLFISPTLELAVVITAGQYNSAAIGTQLSGLFEAIANRLD